MHFKVFIFLFCTIAANAASVKKNRGLEFESCLNEFVDENGDFSLQAFEGTKRCLLGYKDVSKCKFDALNVSYTIFSREGEFQNPVSYLPQCPDPSREVKIIVHGWKSHPSNSWVVKMKNAYLEKGNYYVMTVDWSEAAEKCQYFSSAANTQCVGYKLGHFISTYFRECNIPFENVHIIGHSLGAHVAGFAGKYVLSTANEQIGRISALDPAAFCFDNTEQKDRLSRDDAIIVDVYHTDDVIGFKSAIGDYDFFINDGIAPQPGCMEDRHDLEDMLKGVYLCSHARSHEYFTESIFNEFIASKCTTLLIGIWIHGPNARMGENLQAAETGSYCIETNDKSPFSKTA